MGVSLYNSLVDGEAESKSRNANQLDGSSNSYISDGQSYIMEGRISLLSCSFVGKTGKDSYSSHTEHILSNWPIHLDYETF